VHSFIGRYIRKELDDEHVSGPYIMEATFMLIIFVACFGYEDPLNMLNKKKKGGGLPCISSNPKCI